MSFALACTSAAQASRSDRSSFSSSRTRCWIWSRSMHLRVITSVARSRESASSFSSVLIAPCRQLVSWDTRLETTSSYSVDRHAIFSLFSSSRIIIFALSVSSSWIRRKAILWSLSFCWRSVICFIKVSLFSSSLARAWRSRPNSSSSCAIFLFALSSSWRRPEAKSTYRCRAAASSFSNELIIACIPLASDLIICDIRSSYSDFNDELDCLNFSDFCLSSRRSFSNSSTCCVKNPTSFVTAAVLRFISRVVRSSVETFSFK